MRTLWLARLLFPLLRDWAQLRDPDFKVAPLGEVYLRRWHILKPTWWRPGCYLHQMLRDDDDVLHDHPYSSVSLCLHGMLVENFTDEPEDEEWAQYHGKPLGAARYIRIVYPGRWVRRSAHMAHQLTVPTGDGAWTLFFPGRRMTDDRGEANWGFWCPRGWRHFRDYVKLTGGNSGVGRGCGEMEET